MGDVYRVFFKATPSILWGNYSKL